MNINVKLSLGLLAILCCGCQSNNQYIEPEPNGQYGTISITSIFKDSDKIKVFSINDLSMTFWRLENKPIRMPVGKTKVSIIADYQPYDFEDLHFYVKANTEYQVSIDKGNQSLSLYEINSQKNKLLLRVSKRLDQCAYDKQIIKWAPEERE